MYVYLLNSSKNIHVSGNFSKLHVSMKDLEASFKNTVLERFQTYFRTEDSLLSGNNNFQHLKNIPCSIKV